MGQLTKKILKITIKGVFVKNLRSDTFDPKIQNHALYLSPADYQNDRKYVSWPEVMCFIPIKAPFVKVRGMILFVLKLHELGLICMPTSPKKTGSGPAAHFLFLSYIFPKLIIIVKIVIKWSCKKPLISWTKMDHNERSKLLLFLQYGSILRWNALSLLPSCLYDH